MATKGPNVPHRTSRSIAVTKGTSPGGFASDSGYCSLCGCPSANCKGHYKGTDVTPVSRPSSGANTIK